jgi:hypothetical protein
MTGPALDVAYVIACGAQKAPEGDIARHLYCGQGFQSALRAAEAEARWCASRRRKSGVLILSALHGLITPDTFIAPYDLQMGQPGSVTPRVVAGQAAWHGITQGCDVFGLLPHAYLAVLTAALSPASIWVQDVYERCRGIGDHRQVNRILQECA